MYKIAFVVPTKEMVPLVESVIRQDGSITRNIHNAPRYSYSVHVAKEVQELDKEVLDADVAIARGQIFEDMRRGYPNMPLVELPFGSEMTAVIISALNRFGQLPVAVIGPFSMCYAAQAVRDLFDVDVKAYLLENRRNEEILEFVEKAYSEGRRIIVCGPGTAKIAAAQRYPDLHIQSLGLSRESVLEAMTRAKSEMVTRKREKERALQFQMLINLAHEGIIATDADERINAINPAATSLLGLNAQSAMGADLWSVFPKGALSGLDRSGLNARATFECDGKTVSLRFGRMIMAGESAGVIVTLQEVF